MTNYFELMRELTQVVSKDESQPIGPGLYPSLDRAVERDREFSTQEREVQDESE